MSWALTKGYAVLPRSANPERIAENAAAAVLHSRSHAALLCLAPPPARETCAQLGQGSAVAIRRACRHPPKGLLGPKRGHVTLQRGVMLSAVFARNRPGGHHSPPLIPLIVRVTLKLTCNVLPPANSLYAVTSRKTETAFARHNR